MKRLFLNFLFCLLTSSVWAQNSVAKFDYFIYKGMDDYYKEHSLATENSFYNPVLPGWYSDPSVCTNGKDYFLVTSTFGYYPGVPIFHSKDLVNWKQIGHVLNRPSQLKLEGQSIGTGGIYAPAIEYNPYNQTYYMITTNVGVGNFFVKTKNPFGSWSDPIPLPDLRGIDPSFFFDEDGKAYIVNNDAPEGTPLYDGHRAIRIREFDVKTDRTIGSDKVLVNGGVRLEDKPIWIEGPHLYKINGKYFLMAAEGGTGTNHSEVIFRSDSPIGVFKPWDKNPILTQRSLSPKRPNPVTCSGHADLIRTKNGEWWAFFLACRPIDNTFENLGRETFLMPVKWSEDGFPYMTQGEETIPLMLEKKGVKRATHPTFGNFEKKDSFSTSVLGQEWMTLRGDAASLYSLTDHRGYLTVKCADANTTEKGVPAFICRRMQHHKFECSTRLLFTPVDADESAGLLLFKDEVHQYFLSLSGDENESYLSLEKIGAEGSELMARQSLSDFRNAIGLKVVSNGASYDFYYSVKEGAWEQLCKGIDASYLSTQKASGFTGTTIGLYATKTRKSAKKIDYIMDMVHNNPGEALYESIYNRPDVLKDMGYNSKCYFLFDSPTLAINWDDFDQRILPLGSPEREWVDRKAARIHGMFNDCKQKGLNVYAMSDLILLPKRLIDLYNMEKTYGNPQDTLTRRIVRYQIRQIFKQFPQMDGLVVRIGETYLQDAPFHRGNIQNKSDADQCIIPLMNLLREEICVNLNKKLIFRTWWAFDVDEKKYQYISDKVVPHPNLVVAIKHCEGDFHRGNSFSRVLGMGRHQQLVEVQCAREYEGKGAYPNYIARGVIEGFEEDAWRKAEGKYGSIRDIYQTGKLVGLWTWTRGGGWEGPYPKDELWCDLNAWVLAQWASSPEQTEEAIFYRYAKERLELSQEDAERFRELVLLSEFATLRGMRSASYPGDIFSMWVRDEYITFPILPKEALKVKVLLAEKDTAVVCWEKMFDLARQIKSPDKHLNEVMEVSCQYGLQMYRIYRALFYLGAIRQELVVEDKYKYIHEYDDAWKLLNAFEREKPEVCPSLFSKTVIRRTQNEVADKMVNEMR